MQEREQFVCKVQGKPFRCNCGCNVFHKPDDKRPNVYACNACEVWYEADYDAGGPDAR